MAGKWFLYLTSLMLITMGALSGRIRLWKMSLSDYSLADCFVGMQDVWEFGLMVTSVTVLFLLLFFRQENRTCCIIREESRKSLWNRQIYKGILFSATMTFYFQGCIFVIGGLSSQKLINWDQAGSVYFFSTEQHTNTITFGAFLTVSSIMVFLKLLNVSFLAAFADWNMKRREAVIIITMIAAGAEKFFNHIPLRIFFAELSIAYDRWYSETVLWSMLYGFLLAAAIWYTGSRFAVRKDFLNEEG